MKRAIIMVPQLTGLRTIIVEDIGKAFAWFAKPAVDRID